MNRVRNAVLAAGLLLAVAGCLGESAEQLMKTADFEELQRNQEHARQLYERIVRDFPDSPEAKVAAERLSKAEAPADS
jgi:TolA-binding protein